MHFMTGLEQRTLRANGIRINLWTGGSGPPVLLLHGYPQTAQLWHKVAPRLAGQYTVVCPDLRGYGDSDKPRDGYDKKTMARDMHEVLRALGHSSYALVGHDRGGRVGHRQALDFPEAVTRLCVLDIVPTHTVFTNADRHLAAAYWHWFFFQTPDLPELLIGAAPEAFLRGVFRGLAHRAGAIGEPQFQEYLRAFTLPGTIRATLEDYRAAATRDFDDDARDLERRVRCPVLAVWGEFGKMHAIFDVLGTWQAKAESVQGHALPCGHFIPEEAPDELLADLLPFLSASTVQGSAPETRGAAGTSRAPGGARRE
jgi:haloacetate dehalogenase